MADDIHWFAGVDWASEIHQVVLVDIHGTVMGEHAFPHGGEGLGAMCDWILTTAGAPAEAIGIAIEVPHGPVVETLLERGFQVHSVNPKQLDRFRDRFTVAGAKDDRLDARVLVAPSRSGRGRTARMVSHDRGPPAGADQAEQSRPRATLAVLPTNA